jgi:predicted membrane-bound spermidine synthase
MNLFKKYVPHYVVFLTSMGVMIIELVASRLVSKYLGNNLYTWTSIIGIVLGGISLGNFIGGRLADRFRVRRIISPLLLATSFLIFLILILDLLVYRLMEQSDSSPLSRAMILRSLFLILIFFFLPSTSLGTISPVMAKYALDRSSKVGHTVGSIYAVSAIGSIVGTFLSGFLLIPLLGIATIIFIVAGLVGMLAVLMGTHRIVGAGWIGILIFLFVLSGGKSFSQSLYPVQLEDVRVLYATDTAYSHLEVRDRVDGYRTERNLVMDRLIHNRYDPENPDDLLYEYEQIFASLTDYYIQHVTGKNNFDSLTLGGGACLFPAYLERLYDFSVNDVVEIDPAVVHIAQDYFDVRVTTRLQIIIADARNYVGAAAKNNRQYDIVYLDAFNSFSVPYHLTTVEFIDDVSGLLKPGGLFITNCVDIFSIGKFLNAFIQTVAAVFPHVSVYAGSSVDSSTRSTFVVVGSYSELDREVLFNNRKQSIAGRIPARRLEELHNRNGDLILSDNHAPVEKLIGPVFLAHIK